VTNAWVDALNKAARSIESPTLDELDETLEEREIVRGYNCTCGLCP
jgi:hypothetical protein